MTLQTHFQSLRSLWHRLSEPLAVVIDPEQRQASRLLARLLLALMLVVGLVLPPRYLLTPDSPYTLWRLFGALIGLTALLLAYRLTRQGHHLLAAKLVVVLGTGVIFLSALFVVPRIGVGMLYYLMVVTLFASLFLPVGFTTLVAAVHIAGMLALPIIAPAYSVTQMVEGPAAFSLLLTVIALVFARYRAQLESERRARLAESETRYRIISELISDYAYSYRVEPDGQLTLEWSTNAAGEVTRYIQDALDAQGHFTLYEVDSSSSLRLDLAAVLRGQAKSGEYRIKSTNGEAGWLHIYRQPVWDEAKRRVSRIYGVVQDITARKQAESQKLERILQQERLRLIGGFVEAVSHDFRTSLAQITTNRYLIERTLDEAGREQARPRLDKIEAAIGHMVEQIENLNMVTSLLDHDLQPCDLNGLVEAVVKEQALSVAQKHLILDFQADATLPPVAADHAQLRRAIKQLVVNAIHHTPTGGTVRLRVYRQKGMVMLEIRDTGPGIAPEHLAHIFDFFYRADDARPLDSGGVGLGLSIVRMIAEAHHGGVTVESQAGEGSAFTLLLPAAVEARAAS